MYGINNSSGIQDLDTSVLNHNTRRSERSSELRNLNMTCPNFNNTLNNTLNASGAVPDPDLSVMFPHTLGNDSSFVIDTNILGQQMLHYTMEGILNQDHTRMTDEQREMVLRYRRKAAAFKTALCDSYRKTQECPYGTNCRFAHGTEELRSQPNPRGKNHPKYKTVLCDNFSKSGTCRYGARCQYIHKLTNPRLLESANKTLNFDQAFASLGRSFMEVRANNPRTAALLNNTHTATPSSCNDPIVLTREDISRGFARAQGTNPSVDRLVKTASNVQRTINPDLSGLYEM